MLRRHSTKSKSDLHRRKSTSSVRSVQLEHIDASDAQRDAHIAAAQAFARSKDRSSEAEMHKFPQQPSTPRREQCNSDGISRNNSVTSRGGGESGQDLKRRQSVRFVRPQSSHGHPTQQARSSEEEGSKTQRSIYTPSVTQANRLLGDKMFRSSENLRMPIRDSSRHKTRASTATSRSKYLQTLAKADMLYTPDDDIALMPSSYRRLRKTRSMFTPARPIPLVTNSVTDRTQRETFLSVVSPNGIQGLPYSCSVGYNPGSSRKENRPISAIPGLKAPKSMSFLRNRRERTDPLSSKNGCDTSAQPSKPDIEAFSTRSRLSSKHSVFFMPKTKRQESGMRKTLRSSSSGSALPENITSASLPPARDGTLRKKARKVSSSLKSKIKTLFTFHKSEDNAIQIPEQQVEAQKTHVSRVFDGRYYEDGSSVSSVYREGASLSRVSSHVPTLRAVPPSELLHFRQGSVENIETDTRKASEDKSRVTSWTNSDTESLTTQQQHASGEETEKQRLSVIQEVGTYAPASTLSHSRDGDPFSQDQGDLSSTVISHGDTSSPIVHSDRVYSALMKRANETKQLAGIVEQQRKSSEATADPFRTVSPTTSTSENCSEPNGPALPETMPPTHFKLERVRNGSRDDSRVDRAAEGEQCVTNGNHSSLEMPSPTIRVVPKVKEPYLTPMTLSHRSSAFFGSPECHFFRTKSPYRRALQEAIHSGNDGKVVSETVEASMNHQHLLRHAETSGSDVAGKPVYSASIYSEHDVDDPDVSPPKTSTIHHQPQSSSILGDASVFIDVPTYRPTGSLGQTSPAGPVDWKAWLSANASKLQPQSSPAYSRGTQPTEIEYALPSMPNSFSHGSSGHVRELAQIDDHDEDFDLVVPPTQLPMIQDVSFGHDQPNVVKLSPRYCGALKTTPMNPSLQQENALPSSIESQRRPSAVPSTPPVPSKSPLRPLPAQSLKSTKSARDLGTMKTNMPRTPDQAATVAARRTKSLARLRSLNRIRTTDSGSPCTPLSTSSKLVRGTGSTNPAKTGVVSESITSSPLLSAAVLRQFGPTSPQKSLEVVDDEDRAFLQTPSGDIDNIERAADSGADRGAQVAGSKQMVESFLSSRRRRMTSEDESLAFV